MRRRRGHRLGSYWAFYWRRTLPDRLAGVIAGSDPIPRRRRLRGHRTCPTVPAIWQAPNLGPRRHGHAAASEPGYEGEAHNAMTVWNTAPTSGDEPPDPVLRNHPNSDDPSVQAPAWR